MVNSYVMDAGDYGKGYDKLPDALGSRKFTDNADLRKLWIVKLEFVTDKPAVGTGFFINLPEAANDIILTAGHNLITRSGERTREMKALINDGQQIQTVDIDPSAIKICPEFETNPVASENKINDWGMIILPAPKKKWPGFGFSLRLAFQEFGRKVRAYDEAKDKVVDCSYVPLMRLSSYSVERSGLLVVEGEERLRNDQLEYSIDTEEGMSGSPVWMEHRGGECVVAIHNHGLRGKRGHGSRGTRLNEKVLRQIYAWAGIGHLSKALKVHHSGAPANGVYFQFHDDDAEAWISIGRGSNVTIFDVLPAYAPPSTDRKSRPLYALYLKSPINGSIGKWVYWNRRAEMAELKKTLMDEGLFDIRNKPTEKGFKIVFSRNKTTDEIRSSRGVFKVLEELRVDTSMISEDDLRRGVNEIQGFMVFEPHFKSNETEYNKFVLD